MASGFFPQMFGQTPTRRSGRGLAHRRLRYKVVYAVPGPNGVQSRVVQLVYPYAKPGPLSYMRPGQVFWDGETTHGGWFRATASLKRVLVRAGVPAKPSS